jgi:hypothetical protein
MSECVCVLIPKKYSSHFSLSQVSNLISLAEQSIPETDFLFVCHPLGCKFPGWEKLLQLLWLTHAKCFTSQSRSSVADSSVFSETCKRSNSVLKLARIMKKCIAGTLTLIVKAR